MAEKPSNSVEFGWGAPPMKEQHPVLDAEAAERFDKDSITRLTKKIEATIRKALPDANRTTA